MGESPDLSIPADPVLNLGCGSKPLPGTMNVDVRPLPGVDLVADVSKLPLGDGFAVKILASDILEHFPRAKVPEVLREWFRVLKPGGVLVIKTPNIWAIASLYMTGVIDGVEAARRIYGGQDYEGNFHYAGWDAPYLKALVEAAGFKVIRHVPQMEAPDQTNQTLRAVKP